MEIHMKLSELLSLNNTIKTIIEEDSLDSQTKTDSLLKFKLLGIMKKLELHVTNFEIVRNEKIREYGKHDENDNISISPKDTEAFSGFSEDMNALLNSDVTVNIDKLKASDVFNKGVRAEYLIGLYGIIEE